MNIVETIIALCEKHDLTSISFSVSTIGYRAHAYVHWAQNHSCASGSGETIEEAIGNAIVKANIKRSAMPEVPKLVLAEVAA